jgi:putative transposase
MQRHSFNIPNHVHFLTFSCYRRMQVLAHSEACAMLATSLNSARTNLEFELWSFVFMPDHVHLLLRPRRESYSMAQILRHIKAPFAKHLVEQWRSHHPERIRRLQAPDCTIRVWQRGGGFDRNLHSEELVRRAINYIEWNPVRRGLVTDPLQWEWSSARDRAGIKNGLVDIDDIRWETLERKIAVCLDRRARGT